MEAKLLTTKEVAKLLGKNTQTISRWRRDGVLPKPLVDTRQPIWSEAQIYIWLQLNETRNNSTH